MIKKMTLFALASLSLVAIAGAQTQPTDQDAEHHPPQGGQEQLQDVQSQGMMGMGMMGGQMRMPMMPMRGHMIKVMFAIADTNGDGGLSFEEVTAMHKRIFDTVDANRDAKVTIEEFQSFMRE